MTAPLPNPSLLRLLQLVSPSLPVGGYSYSQGLEWAVEAKWITNVDDFSQWLNEQINGLMTQQDLPLLVRLYHSLDDNHPENSAQYNSEYWDSMAMAMRETSELRLEEEQRGRSLMSLLQSLGIPAATRLQSQLGAFAVFCVAEKIPLPEALAGYAYNWLDSQVTAAIKLVPLGQSEGQGILYRYSELLPAAVQQALCVEDADIGYTSPAVTMASSLHETQYSRLFRS